MEECNWKDFSAEMAVARSEWQDVIGPLVGSFNEQLDEINALTPESTARLHKEKELNKTREKMRQSLVAQCERISRIIAILSSNIALIQQQQQHPPVVSRPVASVASSSGTGGGQEEVESRGRQRSRSRTPQPSSKQGRYEYSSRIKPGSQVAALVDTQWIVANVEVYDEARKKYRVRDPEPTEGKNDLFWVPVNHVLPFYDWEHDPGAPTFASGTTVLAVWPESTELYPGVVIEPPYRGPVCFLFHPVFC